MPSRERRSGGARVTSSPRKRTRPEVVLSSPERRLRKVDLPAPFGPMMAWTAPASMRKEIPATAASAPKRRVSASVSSNASTTGSPQQAREPAGKREDGGDGDGADERVPVRGPLLSEVLEHAEEDRAERGPVQGPLASEEHGDEDEPGLPPAEDGRIDESVQGRVEDAGEAGEGSGGDEGGDLVAARTIAERAHAEEPDHERGHRRPRERERERREGAHQPGTVGEAGEEIGAEPEEGGVREAHDPGVPDQQVEAHREEGGDHHLRRELHPEAVSGERDEGERDGKHEQGDPGPSRGVHRWSAGWPSRPRGRKSSTAAITA